MTHNNATEGGSALPPSKSKIKVSLNLLEGDVDALRAIAAIRGTTLTEAVRQAIATEKFLQEAALNGEKILIEGNDKRLRQLVIR